MPIKQIETHVRISVIIPCHPVHATHLYRLLEILEQQTVLPDEVIVSICECRAMPSTVLTRIEQRAWAFPVRLVMAEKQLFPGQNRNYGSMHATGNVFVYQDCDDEPHPQRIEIIKLLFATYDIDLLMHRFIKLHNQSRMPVFHYSYVDFLWPSDYESQIPGKDIHNGNIAVSKRVFSSFKWPEKRTGEDEDYNRMLYGHIEKRLIVHTPLLMYRYFLSTEGTC
jgi:glycosyltransferase involved in cell wall biosynthesis